MRNRPRSVAWRIAALLMGCWFVLLRAEPVALHACPMHSGVHGHAPAALETTASSAHAHAHAPAAPSSHSADTGCLCLGACCAAGVGIVPTTPVPTSIDVALFSRGAVAAVPYTAAPRGRPARLLPFSTAPPVPA